MRIYDYHAYDWTNSIAPAGNMGKVDPQIASELCDKYEVPWYTDGWPYASGIKVYCESKELWTRILSESKLKY